jgi:hypothetical protein
MHTNLLDATRTAHERNGDERHAPWPIGRVVITADGNIDIVTASGASVAAAHRSKPEPQVSGQRIVTASGPAVGHFSEELGRKKTCEADATLYANGLLVIETKCTSNHRFEGLRAQVFVVCVDDQARGHWVSQVYQCSTVGGTWDPTIPSQMSDVFREDLPEPVGRLTQELHIYADSGPLGDSRRSLMEAIKAGAEVAEEIKPLLALLA